MGRRSDRVLLIAEQLKGPINTWQLRLLPWYSHPNCLTNQNKKPMLVDMRVHRSVHTGSAPKGEIKRE